MAHRHAHNGGDRADGRKRPRPIGSRPLRPRWCTAITGRKRSPCCASSPATSSTSTRQSPRRAGSCSKRPETGRRRFNSPCAHRRTGQGPRSWWPHPDGAGIRRGAEPATRSEGALDRPADRRRLQRCAGFIRENCAQGTGPRIIRMDRKRMIGHFAPGIEIPLRPFFGSMGVAPPPARAREQQPARHSCGNLDNKELVAGIVADPCTSWCAVRNWRWPCGARRWRGRSDRDRNITARASAADRSKGLTMRGRGQKRRRTTSAWARTSI